DLEIKHPRSSKWPKVRNAHLKKQPICQVCGGREHLQVHHRKPYHLHPSLELVDSNLITLCENPSSNCHFLFGHLRNWKAFNPNVSRDAAKWRKKIKNRPLA